MESSTAELELDRRLVEAAQHNPVAFGALYDRYVDRIYAYAYYRTGEASNAEDIAAETFRAALENIGRFEWRGLPFSAWLYRIASNAIAGEYRRQRPNIPYEQLAEVADDGECASELLERKEEAASLTQLVRALPPDQQQAVVLRFSQGLRNRQIATIMNRSEGAVKALLHRAIVSLRCQLAAGGVRGELDLGQLDGVSGDDSTSDDDERG